MGLLISGVRNLHILRYLEASERSL